MRKIKGIEMKGSKQLYTKLFFIYTSVIVSVVVALMVYFIGSTRSRYLENNKQYLGKMQDEIVEYMENCEGIANFLHGELYKSDMEMNDMVHYLQDSPEEYQKYRLDAYTAYQLGIYRGAEAYITGGFDAFESIKRVALVSYSKGDMTYFTEGQNVYHRADGTEILMRIRNNDLAGYGEFSFLKEIRDPNTLQSLGAMIVTFDTKRIQNIQEYYSKAEILVYNVSGTHIYDSDENRKPIVIENARQAGRLEEVLAAYVREDEVDQFRIIGYLDKKQAAKIPEERIAMIISMAVLVILIGVLMVNWYLMHLSTRLNHILDGMSQVMEGELSVRLEAEKNGDELDVISRHFNEMCEKLDLHIKKSYLAEIEQKNAEMAALQSQINPHFLYNTLEAIRMKAICNGDREVGKMLYSMAVTFRSQIKEADVITMAHELYYCKKYLELFEYRYPDQFRSEVDCPLQYMNVPIIKFVIQPIIENYFVHGIRLGEADNFIRILVRRSADIYEIIVEDNGRGMSEEEIENKNRKLLADEMNPTESIGVSNVNRRIRAVYGTEYGVRLEARAEGGLRVILRFRPEEGDL